MKATILIFFAILIVIKAPLDSFSHKTCNNYDPIKAEGKLP